jgi:hypothetical protein
MARMIPVKSEESVSRKVAIKGNEVHLINHSVKAAQDSTDQIVYDRIILVYADAEGTPARILEKAAKTDWITIQRKLRSLSEAERMTFEGRRLQDDELEQILGLKQKRTPFKDRVQQLARKEITLAEFTASLTKAEQEIWSAMKELQENN